MILCLDFGARFIGVAITDPECRIALRHSTIDQNQKEARLVLREIITKENIKKILVGVPLGLEGQETQQTHMSLEFIEALRREFGEMVEIEGVDETLTSVEAAQRLAAENPPSRKAVARRGKKEDEHTEAARLMLETYLREVL